MNLAVVGSRDIDPSQYWIVRWNIQSVAYRVGWADLRLISGGALGVDSIAARAAKEFGIPIDVSGTSDTVRRAVEKGIPVTVFDDGEEK